MRKTFEEKFSDIPENALKIITNNNTLLKERNYALDKNTKYSKKKFLSVYRGYDFLENLSIAREYIRKRYDVDLKLLEVFLYLGPKNYFTKKDYYEMPKNFRYNRISTMLKFGHIVIVQEGKDIREHIFQLSVPARNVIRKFYELLSGEMKFPEIKRYNPLADKNAIAYDKIKMNIMRKVNKLEPSENKKKLFK